MIKVEIHTVGKLKERWLEEAVAEYCKRLTGRITVETKLHKDGIKLEEACRHFPSCHLLDPLGKQLTSEQLADSFTKWSETERPIRFAIGGAEGFSKEFKKGQDLLSLSKLTFTHQFARLLLVEQLYRAHCITSGIAYHKY